MFIKYDIISLAITIGGFEPCQDRKVAAIRASDRVCHFFIIMNRENEYMREALKEAYKAKKIDEVPIGAVVVRNGEIIARAHNMKEHDQLASSHAEHLALTKAQKILGTWNLQDCDLYVTLEPCMMCTGLIQLSRIRRLYYGTSDPKGGCLETVIHVKQIPHLNTYPKEIYADIMKEECSEILTTFFKEKRNKNKHKNHT